MQTNAYTLLLPGMIALFCYLSVAQEKKIKYYHLTTIPTDRSKLLLGKIIYIGCMILFSNVIVFAGASFGGFLLTTHVPVGGALIAVLFLTVSELWEIPVALFLSERFGMIVMPSGMVISVKLTQLSNALLPSSRSPSGSVILPRVMQ